MTAPLPPQATLGQRILWCIGIWETNRGGTKPDPKESALDTLAGVHASMASYVQATMPYAVDAIRNHAVLRALATPALTGPELGAADACCVAVSGLLKAVDQAAAASQAADDYIRRNGTAIRGAFLSDDDVRTMFAGVALRARLDALRKVTKPDKDSMRRAAEGIPEDERLGLGVPSLMAYIRTAGKWGENRAGWQRKAVCAMPNRLGARVNQVATAEDGSALPAPVIRDGVAAELAKVPVPTEQDIVTAVATRNNPWEPGYGGNVLAIYTRLYLGTAQRTVAAAEVFDTHSLVRTLSTLSDPEAEFALQHLQARKRAQQVQ